jgi:hypothetical protein
VIALRRRVVTGVVAEGPFVGDLVLVDVALEHELGVRRHFEAHGLAGDELDGLAAQEAGQHQLVDVLGERRAGGVGRDRIAPERDGDLDPAVGREVVGAPVLVDLPMHRRRVRAELLHPVHADVARARPWILRDHGR